MLDKSLKPAETQFQEYLGCLSYGRLMAMEEYLNTHYQLVKEIRFPFGKIYGWGYKYSHKSSHLCYAFFEKGDFTVTIQIGDKQAQLVEDVLPSLLPKTQELWRDRYPCGEYGEWLHYRVLTDEEWRFAI
jgi:hypothetical protein